MDILVIALLLCLIMTITVFTLCRSLFSLPRSSKVRNLPPRPSPLPIIGNINKLGNQPHISLANLAQIYGPIMHLQLGHKTTIVVSSSYTAQEVLQKQDLAFSSRSIPHAVDACNHSKYSVIMLPVSSQWRSLRRIMTTKLFTVNRLDSNQHLRIKKVQELIGYCRKCGQTGEAVDIGRAAFRTSVNLLSNTIFSKDMADLYEDSAKEFKDLISNIMLESGHRNDLFAAGTDTTSSSVEWAMTEVLKNPTTLLNAKAELNQVYTEFNNLEAAQFKSARQNRL